MLSHKNYNILQTLRIRWGLNLALLKWSMYLQKQKAVKRFKPVGVTLYILRHTLTLFQRDAVKVKLQLSLKHLKFLFRIICICEGF